MLMRSALTLSIQLLIKLLLVTGFCLFCYAAYAQEMTQLQMRITSSDGATVFAPTAAGDVTVPDGQYTIELISSIPVARMRVQTADSHCNLGQTTSVASDDDPTTSQDDDPASRFVLARFDISAENGTCNLAFNAWYENFRWAGNLFGRVTFESAVDEPPQASTTYRITTGSDRRTEMDTSSLVVDEQAHGTRVYCPVSHYSYDDPIVFPGEPSAAHLHIFWGNTQADAFSTTASLLSTGNSSCEGGLNNKSAYWAPALFNAQDEVVLPESVIVYYKSFSHTSGFDRNSIMPIPNGLQMLANQDVPNSGPWNFRSDAEQVGNEQRLRFAIAFPMCVQVDTNGLPVLSSEDNVSHLSYSVGSGETSGDCPLSHPYRIPQLSYNLIYDVAFNSQWYLASDHNPQMQGRSLHADYFAAWDEPTMNAIVLCNRESRRECQFIGQQNGQPVGRTQLPERFVSPDQSPVYVDSLTLMPATDRTPFGTLLGKGHNH